MEALMQIWFGSVRLLALSKGFHKRGVGTKAAHDEEEALYAIDTQAPMLLARMRCSCIERRIL